MSGTDLSTFLVALATLVTAVATLVTAFRTNGKLQQTHNLVNSMSLQNTKLEKAESRAEGIAEGQKRP